MGHARALAGVENVSLQLTYFHRTVEDKLSVRALEQLIRGGGNTSSSSTASSGASSSGSSLPSEVIEIRDELSEQFGTKVEIKRDSKGSTTSVTSNSNTAFSKIAGKGSI